MHKVELFIPGVVDQFYPQTAFNTVRLLERAGCEVTYNPLQTTVGLDLYEAGYWEEAKEVGSKFLHDFTGHDYIVSPSVPEVHMIKEGFDDLFTNSTDHNRCRQIQRNVFDISDFLVHIARKEYFGAEFATTATYHACCSVWNSHQPQGEALRLLAQVGGMELVSSEASPDYHITPCRIGRATKSHLEDVSVHMGEEVLKQAIALQAEYVICQDHQCLMHLQGIIDKQNLSVKTIHLVDVLAAGWPNI